MRATTLLCALLAGTAVVNAAFVQLDFLDPSMTDKDHENDLNRVGLDQGDILKITLPENPTTGYVWRYLDP